MAEYIVCPHCHNPLSQNEYVKVVRCMDCKHYGCYDGSTWCSRTYEQVPSGTCDYQTVEPDGFCKWGKPKAEYNDNESK